MAITDANLDFPITPEVKAAVKEQRLQYFERMIADSQVSIRVYDALIAEYNQAEDIAAHDLECVRLDRWVLSYNTVLAE